MIFHFTEFLMMAGAELKTCYSYRYLLGRDFASGALYAGPTANLLVSEQPGNSDYTWYSLFSKTGSDRDIRFWIGVSGGFRLFNQ